jgi:hypothetical protein
LLVTEFKQKLNMSGGLDAELPCATCSPTGNLPTATGRIPEMRVFRTGTSNIEAIYVNRRSLMSNP